MHEIGDTVLRDHAGLVHNGDGAEEKAKLHRALGPPECDVAQNFEPRLGIHQIREDVCYSRELVQTDGNDAVPAPLSATDGVANPPDLEKATKILHASLFAQCLKSLLLLAFVVCVDIGLRQFHRIAVHGQESVHAIESARLHTDVVHFVQACADDVEVAEKKALFVFAKVNASGYSRKLSLHVRMQQRLHTMSTVDDEDANVLNRRQTELFAAPFFLRYLRDQFVDGDVACRVDRDGNK